jgi:hypothetical protein
VARSKAVVDSPLMLERQSGASAQSPKYLAAPKANKPIATQNTSFIAKGVSSPLVKSVAGAAGRRGPEIGVNGAGIVFWCSMWRPKV